MSHSVPMQPDPMRSEPAAASVQLSIEELELTISGLAEIVASQRRLASTLRGARDFAGAAREIGQLTAVGALMTRLVRELARCRDAATKEPTLTDQCDGCGALGAQPHASDCEVSQS